MDAQTPCVIVHEIHLRQELHELELVQGRQTREGVLVQEAPEVHFGQDRVGSIKVDGSLLGLLDHLSIGELLVLTLELELLEIEPGDGVEDLLHRPGTALKLVSCRFESHFYLAIRGHSRPPGHRPLGLRGSGGHILVLLPPLGLLLESMNVTIGFLRTEIVTMLLDVDLIVVYLSVTDLVTVLVPHAPQGLRDSH